MENTQLYDFELTDEEMEQIEALEKMRSMTGTWSISESDVMWKTGGRNEDITKTKRKQEDVVKYLPVFSKADYWLYLY